MVLDVLCGAYSPSVNYCNVKQLVVKVKTNYCTFLPPPFSSALHFHLVFVAETWLIMHCWQSAH